MTTLNVQKRNSEKAKKLLKEGFVAGNLFGKEIENSILLKIPKRDAEKMLQTCSKGSQLYLNLDGKQYDVLLKEIGHDCLSGKVIDLEFQALVKGEKVHSTATIMLLNEGSVLDGVVDQLLPEISYKATPDHIVNRIEIDCKGLKFGQTIKLKELPIFQNKDIEIITNPDTLVLTITASSVKKEEDAEEAEKAAAAGK